MTSQTKAPTAQAQSYPIQKTSRTFFVGLLTIALILLIAGVGAFWYLKAHSPLALLSQRDRPIATATAFVPAKAGFSFSLLTNPDKLVALAQALPGAEQQPIFDAAAQIKQGFFKNTLLDYDRDIQPWIGEEITIARTDEDLDFDGANGEQPGYLLALEIDPARSQQARETLQLFWQRQSLSGHKPASQEANGVRILYSNHNSQGSAQRQSIAASALVGNQFVLFANDVRAIRHSLRAAETATNLAQNRAYRLAANRLPQNRLGLAYLHLPDTATNHGQTIDSSFIAVALSPNEKGLAATALWPQRQRSLDSGRQPVDFRAEGLRFVPEDSAIALDSRNLAQLLTQLDPTLAAINLPFELPGFLQLQTPSKRLQENGLRTEISSWQWATGEYTLAKKGAGKADDWTLVVQRDPGGVAQLDAIAESKGYKAIPLAIGEQEAIAWTRFKTRTQRRQSSGLETEILGLHLQQGDYEIFASSIVAMDDAIGAAVDSGARSLANSSKFIRATSGLSLKGEGYLYLDRAALSSAIAKSGLKDVADALMPITDRLDAIAATKEGDIANIFIPFENPNLAL